MTKIEELAKELVDAQERMMALDMMNQPDKYEDRVQAEIDRHRTRVRIGIALKNIEIESARLINETTLSK